LIRRLAFLPLLIAACHTPYTPFLGGLTVCRVVILIGLIRAATNGWLSWSARNRLDLLLAIFAIIALCSTLGHQWQTPNPLIVRLRLVLDVMGAYLYMRAYLADADALHGFSRSLAIIMIPFAIFLLIEKKSGINPYAKIGSVNSESMVRDGKTRAQGPFGTPILTGTVGAVAIPLLIPLWRNQRRIAMAGLMSSFIVVYATASSGPIGTALLGLAAVALWKWRQHLKPLLIGLCTCLIVLHLIKERPIWYLMALMDLVGGSTGWHRAYLIDMALQHLNEWWWCGTDYTRHWMPYGLVAVPEHCDLTNYYIHLGVIGGLPLALTLLAIQMKSFRLMGRRMAYCADEFWIWCLGSALFSHMVTFLTISYFDQIYVFYWGLLGGLTGFITGKVIEIQRPDFNASSAKTVGRNWCLIASKLRKPLESCPQQADSRMGL
jgi:hypothetical protein